MINHENPYRLKKRLDPQNCVKGDTANFKNFKRPLLKHFLIKTIVSTNSVIKVDNIVILIQYISVNK